MQLYLNKTKLLFSTFIVLYSLTAFLIFWQIGFLPVTEDLLFSTPDSKTYRIYADFFTGNASVPRASIVNLRPFVFPLYLSTYFYVGAQVFFIIQWLLNLSTIYITFKTILLITKSRLCSLLGIVFIIINPTFSFISLHALTETLSLTLISLTIYNISLFFSFKHARSLFLSNFFLSLAVCAKPTYLPFFLLWVPFTGYYFLVSATRSFRTVIPFLFSLNPLIIQFALTSVLTGNVVLSTAGRSNFEGRFFPAVYGFSQGEDFLPYSSPEAMNAKKQYANLQDKVEFVLAHPYATIQTVVYLLRVNLRAASSFTNYPKNLVKHKKLSLTLKKFSKAISRFMAPLHLVGLLAIFVFLLAHDPDSYLIFFLACLLYSVITFSVLTYWQGDRLILAALPAWTVLYVLIASKILKLIRSITKRLIEQTITSMSLT
ncbi:membrane hypothetical protein [uncultured Desulfatiglans sp.]|uniref:Glycosyltransferase RgtA/B/C/D-like domain-containing protein n=1 Tax=Uncultured Desulfatiglans sp. TaxID=1748965 RepID=A0A653A6D1_UNCDX|nr:membrane hypothetical protein [uncultured Desulfatiglans sp.]